MAFLVLLAAGVICAVAVLWSREPRYGGRALSTWLADLDIDSRHSELKATEAVRAIGTNALPWLAKMLCADEPAWKRVLIAFNAKQGFIRVRVTPASVIRYRAVRGYGVLAGGAKDSVPELIRILETETSPHVRACAAMALGSIGREAKAALPALGKAAQDPN